MAPPTPDASYSIDAAARARLQPGVDADALERLLRCFPTEFRASHLDMFSIRHMVVDADGRRLALPFRPSRSSPRNES